MGSRRVDMVNLVGWHVIFANGLKRADLDLVEGIIKQIKKVVHAPIFTDAGSVLKLKKGERRRLFQIYSLFDILSLNENELRNLGRSLGLREGDEFLLLHELMKAGSFKTVWLHTHEYQAGLSTTYERKVLECAQKTAAAAGACRVEKGGYPTLDEIKKKLQSEAHTKLGTQIVKRAIGLHGKKIGKANFVVTPAYVKKGFASTVGAGDVSAAACTYVLASKR
jgi:ADP-dependent phosphofructokinase/glucokinase